MILRNLMVVIAFISIGLPSQAQSLSTKNNKAIELYTQADNYRVRGQYKEAVSLLQQAIEKDKKFVEAYYRLAITYKSMENLPLSAATFEQGLGIVQDASLKKSFLYELTDVNLNREIMIKPKTLAPNFFY
jgi:OOP family OmpA-OmpF porin